MFARCLLFFCFLLFLPAISAGQWVVSPVDTLSKHAPGDTVSIDITLNGDGAPINALGFDFYFPNLLVKFTNFDFNGTLLESWMFKNINQLDSNIIRVAGMHTTGTIAAPATGILLKTKFVVKSDVTGEGIFSIEGFTDGLKNALTAPDTFKIWQNSPPEIRSEPVTFCLEDVLYEYLIDVFDPDPADQLTFQFITAPPWLEINPNTGLISGTPRNKDVGQHTVSFFVTDHFNTQIIQTYLLTVENVNDPPTAPLALLAPAWGDTTTFETTQFVWRTGSDPDLNDVISYQLEIFSDQALSNLNFSRDNISDTSFAFNEIPDYATKFQTGVDYFWRVRTIDQAGSQSQYTEVHSFKLVEGKITKIPKNTGKPGNFELSPNFPNPFNPKTVIKYQLPRAEKILLRVFNLAGQQVRLLTDSHQPAGYYQVTWDGRNAAGNPVPSGAYILQLESSQFFATRKMLLIK